MQQAIVKTVKNILISSNYSAVFCTYTLVLLLPCGNLYRSKNRFIFIHAIPPWRGQ